MNKKPSDILSGPEKWTKGASFRDKNGESLTHKEVLEHNSEGISFCLVGLGNYCGYNTRDFTDMLGFEYASDLANWNDNPDRKFEEVRNLLIRNGL